MDFEECPADSKIFTLNVNKTSAAPDPIVKGTNLLINMIGDLSDTIYVENVLFEVESDDEILFGQNITVSNTFNNTVTQNATYPVPSLASSGEYELRMTGFNDSN